MKTLAKSTTLITSAALSLALALPSFAQDANADAAPATSEASADMVVATVNGEDITLGHVIAARLSLPDQYKALPNEVLFPGLIDQLIQQTLLGQATDSVSNRAQVQIDNERRAILASEELDKIIAGAVDEEKIQAAYDAQYANAEPTMEWNASHILVDTEEEAQALLDELNGGADFAELAKEKSTGPTGANGGSLDWFGPGMMVQPFEDAVQNMDVGEVAGPIQTQFGWHVIKLNDTREKGAPALEEVRDEIVAQLENAAVDAALADMLENADVERANVEKVDPNVIGDLSLLD